MPFTKPAAANADAAVSGLRKPVTVYRVTVVAPSKSAWVGDISKSPPPTTSSSATRPMTKVTGRRRLSISVTTSPSRAPRKRAELSPITIPPASSASAASTDMRFRTTSSGWTVVDIGTCIPRGIRWIERPSRSIRDIPNIAARPGYASAPMDSAASRIRARIASEKPTGREIEIACFIGEVHSRVSGRGTFAVSAETADGTADAMAASARKTIESRRRIIKRQR